MLRERVELAAATSVDEYEWALRESLNAAQDDVFMRSLPPELSDGSPAIRLQSDLRDLAMADNLMWVQQRESSRGKTFFFAYDAHVLASLTHSRSPTRPDLDGPWRPTGMYLRSALGRDMVVMGSWFGHGASLPAWMLPQPTEGAEGLLNSLPCL